MSETLFSRRNRYEECFFYQNKKKPVYGWTFKFLKKRYRVYVFDDLFSLIGYPVNMTRLFIVKLNKSKQIVIKDVIGLFEPFGIAKKEMRNKVKQLMIPHLKQHLGL